MNYMERAMAPAEAKAKAIVEFETFGHLYPERGAKYNGWIEWCVGCFGDITIVRYHFDGLGDSPVLFDDMYEFLGVQDHLENGFYRWKGWYRKYKNWKCRFQMVDLEQIQFRKAA